MFQRDRVGSPGRIQSHLIILFALLFPDPSVDDVWLSKTSLTAKVNSLGSDRKANQKKDDGNKKKDVGWGSLAKDGDAGEISGFQAGPSGDQEFDSLDELGSPLIDPLKVSLT